jgi:Subtilase family
MKRWLAVVAAVLILAGSPASAQTGKDGRMAKVTHSLAALHEQYIAQMAQRSAVSFRSNDPLVRVVNDRVVVDAIASGNVDTLKSDLMFLGMSDAVAFGRIVSGHLPIWAIPAAAALASLQFAQPAVAIANVGLVTSQGDQAMRADLVHAALGLTGSGITVGALSDSFNCLGGAATDMSSGDLPPVTVIEEIALCTNATDEGRALLQIVHDVAPGASLSFASAFNGQASFASNILALAAAGARVIVDDVLYFAEPMFQDGIIAQAVDTVVAGGAAYFSAAGNQARQSYQSVFRAGDSFADGTFPSIFGAPSFLGGTAHNFDSSGGKNHFQSITIPAFTTVVFSLQWDSPFFSVSGPPGTQNDLDIYLLDESATQVLAGSAFNNVGGDAVEVLGVRNNGTAPVIVKLMIVRQSGADPGLIKYVYFGPAVINDFDTRSGTIFGHSNAVGAEAVGAAQYFNTPAFGVFPPILASFSSTGPTPILFDSAGKRLATPDLRSHKPEIVAPDGIDTTFFGSDTDGNGFPNFFGTSAAAPHAAGIAALLFQVRPKLSRAKIYTRLENSAIDMSAPGFDNDTGFGLIQADGSLFDHQMKGRR